MENIDPERKICYNCKHLAWMIAIGQGLRCMHGYEPGDKLPPMVPSRFHTCESFQKRKNEKEKEGKWKPM